MFQTFDIPTDPASTGPRLAALRAALEEAGLDGFLVPRADAHQGETIAPSEARLPWLTGFTGTAGLAAVLAARAALFVDGRYTLQAATQTDPALVEVVATHETPAAEWLAAALQPGMVIGYDPWLHGREEIRRLSTAAEGAGARLTAVKANPIDRLWADRPAPPMGAVRLHPEALAGESAADKRARLGAELGAAGVAAAVLSLPDSIAWLLNIRGADLSHVPVALAFAILQADGGVSLFIAGERVGGAVRAALGEAVRICPPDTLGAALDALAGQRVRVDERTCPMWIADRLTRAGAELDWGADPCLLPKARKTPAEIAGMQAAHRRDGAAMVAFLHWLDGQAAAGESPDEITIAERLEACRAATGALRDIAFDSICGAGPNGAIVHYRVNRQTNRRLAPGEILLVDSGGQYEDGTTDITRTVAFGPVRADARRPFTLVLKGLVAISTARWPKGLAGRDLDPLARRALWAAGYDYDHGTGHGVGAYLNVHEGPAAISRRSGTVALEPGMVLSNEPGYYRAGEFGIRLENLVVVREAAVPEGGERAMLGMEDITLCPFDLRLVEPGLLTAEERAWLDAYHARVRDTLAPDLPAALADWLAAATAPVG